MNEFKGLLTVNDVSKKLKVSPQYVRRLINEKKIQAYNLSNQWIIQETDFSKYLKKNNIDIEPEDHSRKSSKLPKIVALSFFSGGMGLDIGMSNGGIHALLACEFNKYCRMTIEHNNPNIALIGDIKNYSADDILAMAKVPKNHSVDVIFGGPPCQAFSTAGARRSLDDDRGNIFLRYIDIVKQIKPKYVVIENVRGLLSAVYYYEKFGKEFKGGALCLILDRLEAAGYTLSFELYNAANFGAPQIRERIIIIGKLGNKKVPYLSPTHSCIEKYGLHSWTTLREALIGLHESKQHYIKFPEKRLRFYKMLKEGQYWKDLPVELHKEAMGNKLKLGGGKTGFLRRLSYSKPSPTLVTNPTMPATDLCHPVKDRPLSVEEYSRIQGFPDDWKFCGPILEQYRQIGNAVPIKLGEAVAKTIIADMMGKKLKQFDGFEYSRYRNTSDVTWKKALLKSLGIDGQVSLFD